MPDRFSHHPSRAEAISAYRDALLRDAPSAELGQIATALDPEIVQVLALFRDAQREAEVAPPAFVHRLEQHLNDLPFPTEQPTPGTTPLRVQRSHAVTVTGRHAEPLPPATVSQPARGRPRLNLPALASLSLLVLTLVLSLVAFGPLRPAGPRTSLEATIGEGQLDLLWTSTGAPAPDALAKPYGIGIDPQGQIWVADGSQDQFAIFAPDGTFLEMWGAPGTGEGQFEFYSTASCCGTGWGDVAFGADGTIYVLDTGNQRVQMFTPDRALVRGWGSKGDEPGQFLAPGGIAIGPDGSIYISDEARQDVQKFDATGQFLTTIGETGVGAGQLQQPSGVAVDADGNVWVADYAMHRITRFSPTGEVLTTWGTYGKAEGQLDNPDDVAVDQAGTVFVADENNNRLQAFTADGRFLAVMSGTKDEPRMFTHPEGVEVDPDGVIYMSDSGSVQAFQFTRFS